MSKVVVDMCGYLSAGPPLALDLADLAHLLVFRRHLLALVCSSQRHTDSRTERRVSVIQARLLASSLHWLASLL